MSGSFFSALYPHPNIFSMETCSKGPQGPWCRSPLPQRHSGPASAVAAPTQPELWVRRLLVLLLLSSGQAGSPPPGRKCRGGCISQEMKGAADAANPGAWLGCIFPALDESQLHSCSILVQRMQDPQEPQGHPQKPMLGCVPVSVFTDCEPGTASQPGLTAHVRETH